MGALDLRQQVVQPDTRRYPGPAELPHGDGQVEFGPDLRGSVIADRSRGAERLCGQHHPRRMPQPDGAAIGQRRHAAHLGLGQQPQVRFRPLAVHSPSVPGQLVSPGQPTSGWP